MINLHNFSLKNQSMNTNTKVEHLKDKGIFGKCTWVSDRYQSMTPHGFTRYALSLNVDERKDNDFIASIEISTLNEAFDVLDQISEVRSTTMQFLGYTYNSLLQSGNEKFVLNFYNYWHSDLPENHRSVQSFS